MGGRCGGIPPGPLFPRKGHTHYKMDGRFSVVATTLSKEPRLETPEDFMQVIDEKVGRSGNRELFVEKIDGSYDWKTFFNHLGMQIQGIVPAPTARQLDVCHSWRTCMFIKM